MGTQGGTAALFLTHSAHVWQVALLQAVAGTATAFFNPASTGLTPMTVSEERLQQANALRGLSMSSTGLIGLALGGAVVTLAGPGWALAVDAASYGVSAYFLAQLRLPTHIPLPPQSFLRDLHDGWREFVCADLGLAHRDGGGVREHVHVVLRCARRGDLEGGSRRRARVDGDPRRPLARLDRRWVHLATRACPPAAAVRAPR